MSLYQRRPDANNIFVQHNKTTTKQQNPHNLNGVVNVQHQLNHLNINEADTAALNRVHSIDSIQTTNSDSDVYTPVSSRNSSHESLQHLEQVQNSRKQQYSDTSRFKLLNGGSRADAARSWRQSVSNVTVGSSNSDEHTTIQTLLVECQPENYKTELCRHYANGRSCPKGDSCNFAHDVDELRRKPLPATYHNQPCADSVHAYDFNPCQYNDTGKSRCNYAHPGSQLQYFARPYTQAEYEEYRSKHWPNDAQPFGMFM